MVLTLVFCVPGSLKVLVAVDFTVDCSETGQFSRPVDWYTVAMYVTSVLVAVEVGVAIRSFLAASCEEVIAALVAALALPDTAYALPIVVYQTGIWV